MKAEFEHVSDTALLVAASRAMETERPDGLVRDPFAAKLAGEKGMALARSMSGRVEWMSFGIGLRSHFIDELLIHVLAQGGVSTVLNLGAGLDTRPWRLALPRDLRWIEVDFPAMLAYKAEVLAAEAPHCRLERASADLSEDAERRRVIELAASGSTGTLMLTEGLLMYLPAVTVQALARDTLATSAFRFWLLDVTSARLQRIAHGTGFDRIGSLRAETHLESEAILKVVNENGWTPAQHRSWLRDSWAIAEPRLLALMKATAEGDQPSPTPPPPDDPSGVWLYESKR